MRQRLPTPKELRKAAETITFTAAFQAALEEGEAATAADSLVGAVKDFRGDYPDYFTDAPKEPAK